jgi:hypothetical protein
MKRMFRAMLVGVTLFLGWSVAAQETTTQPKLPQHGMGSMMGKGMMGGRQMGPMGDMGSMMQMMEGMQGMMQMMEGCNQMMGETASTAPDAQK